MAVILSLKDYDMYIVANKCKGDIVIADLKVSIPPNQSRDLHAIKTAIEPEVSSDLKRTIKLGKLIVVKHDIPARFLPPRKKKIIREKNIPSITKEEIAAIIREEISKNKIVKTESLPVEELLGKINLLLSAKNVESSKEESNIDEEVLKQIHTKVLDKRMKNVEASINEEKEETKDSSDILSNVEELEGLIG